MPYLCRFTRVACVCAYNMYYVCTAWPPTFCDTFYTFLYHISVVLGRKLLFPKSPVFSVVLRSMDTVQHFSRRSATVLSCSLLQLDFLFDPYQQQRTGSNFVPTTFFIINHITQQVQEG